MRDALIYIFIMLAFFFMFLVVRDITITQEQKQVARIDAICIEDKSWKRMIEPNRSKYL